MSDYIVLLGAEEVDRASIRFQHSIEEFSRQVQYLGELFERYAMSTNQLGQDFEQLREIIDDMRSNLPEGI
jgi:endonuclease IV